MTSKLINARCAWLAAVFTFSGLSAAHAAAPKITVGYQPMVSTGLTTHQPFEAWFVLDKSSDPRTPGYAIPKGAAIRIVFPKEFTPKAGLFQGAVMLPGWIQGPIAAKFTATQDPTNPRAIIIKFSAPIATDPPLHPGLKDIHIRARVINPAAGRYPISITFSKAGALDGTTEAVARITRTPTPNIAAYNELNGGKGSNWQRVKPGEQAPIPVDYLVTLPNAPRSVIAVSAQPDGSLKILGDGKPIGSIKAQGVPVKLTPVAFGPGKSRLGIIRINVKAGNQPGAAEIVAALNGGTQYKITLIVKSSSNAGDSR